LVPEVPAGEDFFVGRDAGARNSCAAEAMRPGRGRERQEHGAELRLDPIARRMASVAVCERPMSKTLLLAIFYNYVFLGPNTSIISSIFLYIPSTPHL
jgi:hypothetical protein